MGNPTDEAEQDGDDGAPGADAEPADHPIESQVLLVAAAKASVAPAKLPELVRRADADLRGRREAYRRTYERVVVAEDDGVDADVYLVPPGHWAEVGDRLGMNAREADAVRRAHEEQLRRFGGGTGRRDEVEAALEIREAVVVCR